MAERGGFEPPNGNIPLTVFETAAFDRSAISPVFSKKSVLTNIACKNEKASGDLLFCGNGPCFNRLFVCVGSTGANGLRLFFADEKAPSTGEDERCVKAKAVLKDQLRLYSSAA